VTRQIAGDARADPSFTSILQTTSGFFRSFNSGDQGHDVQPAARRRAPRGWVSHFGGPRSSAIGKDLRCPRPSLLHPLDSRQSLRSAQSTALI
jgi:hypothetical protein